jgi:HEPN domain-containing protein
MTNRSADWFRQAEADLRHARNSLEHEDYEWACFAAQQAAEKGLEAVVQALGGEPWGHSATVLLGGLEEKIGSRPGIIDAAKRLDKHYIPTRCPSGFDQGAPTDYYTAPEAEAAIADATLVLGFCRDSLG